MPTNVEHAYYKFYCYVEGRDEVMRSMNKASRPQSAPAPKIYREAAFGCDQRLPNAKRLQETSLCLQVHPTLEEEHMHAVGEAVARSLRRAGGA